MYAIYDYLKEYVMLTTILTLAFAFFAIIAVLPGILAARKRHWVEALSRLIIAVVSALVASLLTSLIASALGKVFVPFVTGLVPIDSVDSILTEIPTAETLAVTVTSLCLVPVLFIFLFQLIHRIAEALAAKPLAKAFLIIGGAIAKKDYVSTVYPSNNDTSNKKKFDFASALIGAVCGLFVYITILSPVAGTFDLLGQIGDLSTEQSTLTEMADAASENVGTKTVNMLGGKAMYNIQTSFGSDDEKIDFVPEVKFALGLFDGIDNMSNDAVEPIATAKSLRDAGELVDDTEILPAIVAEFVNAAGEKWIAGEEYHGIPCPDLGEGTKDIVVSLLTCLKGSTEETMKEDLKSIINILAIIAENPVAEGEEFTAIISNQVLVKKISAEVLGNERLAPMIKHLLKSTVSGPAPVINVELPAEDDPQYNEFIDSVVNGYSENINTENATESLEKVSDSVGTTLDQYGVEVDDGTKTAIAAALMSEFSDKEMTPEALKQFIAENLDNYSK